MKKTIAFLVALTLVLGLLAGCAKTEQPAAPEQPAETSEPVQPSEPEQAEEPEEPVGPDYANSTVILYTGNVRGNVEVYEQIAAAKAAYEETGAAVYLVDAGNYLQGTAYANSDRGLSVYNLMDAAGYNVAAMGPYEFVYGDATTGYIYHSNLNKYYTQAELYLGAEELEYQKNAPWADEAVMDTRAAKDAASFAVICSNLTAGEEASGYYAFEPNVVLGGALKVGFVSAADESIADLIQDGYLDGYSFGETAVPDCDVLVCLGGGVDADLVIEVPIEGEMIVGAYVIDNATKAVTEEAVDLSGSDADVAALAASLEPAAVVGVTEVTLDGSDRSNWNGETNLGDLTADALLWYAQNKAEGLRDVPVVAIQNGGNCDNYIYPGEITEVDLLKALPFSPMGIGVVYVTGAQLLETLEAATQCESCPGWAQVAGLEYTVDTAAAYDAGEEFGSFFRAASINRVTITAVGGEAFDPDATYAVIGDNFLMNGNDTYYTFGEIKEAGEDYVEISSFGGLKTRDVVAMYIQEVLGGTAGSEYAVPQGRITVQ